MDEEIELKWTEINKEQIVKHLKDINADHKWSKPLRTVAFDGDNISSTNSNQRYLRVRDYDGTTKITFKEPIDPDESAGRPEIEFNASSFEEPVELFTKLGLEPTQETQKHRDKWVIGNTEVVIDKKHGLPPYMEVEAPTHAELEDVAKKLGLDPDEGSPKSIAELHPEYFTDKH